MAYTLIITFALGSSQTGKTMNAQLRDASNNAVGGAITSGFYEGAAGEYHLTASIPDGHQGRCEIYEQGVGTVLASAPINPQETEYSDVKTSTRSDGTGVTLAAGAITAAVVATDAIDADALAADAVDEIAVDVWAYATRTLTQAAASVTSTVSGTDLTLVKADSFSASLTGLADNTGYTSIWFTVKEDLDDADSASIFQIKKNASGVGDGLLYVNGAAASNAALGSITVDSATALTIALDESITDDLTVTQGLFYSVKYLVSGSTSTVTAGQLDVDQYSTKAIV